MPSMNAPTPPRGQIVILACLGITVIRLHAGGAHGSTCPTRSQRTGGCPGRTDAQCPFLGCGAPTGNVPAPREAFNRGDCETVVNHIPNAEAWDCFCLMFPTTAAC